MIKSRMTRKKTSWRISWFWIAWMIGAALGLILTSHNWWRNHPHRTSHDDSIEHYHYSTDVRYSKLIFLAMLSHNARKIYKDTMIEKYREEFQYEVKSLIDEMNWEQTTIEVAESSFPMLSPKYIIQDDVGVDYDMTAIAKDFLDSLPMKTIQRMQRLRSKIEYLVHQYMQIAETNVITDTP